MTRMSEREFAKLTGQPVKRNKHNNNIVKTEEGTFQSELEYRRWCELKVLLRTGAIQDLRRQVPFKLIVNGLFVCKYYADFGYTEDGAQVVEDTKGYATDVYKMKRRLMMAVHGVEIKEVK